MNIEKKVYDEIRKDSDKLLIKIPELNNLPVVIRFYKGAQYSVECDDMTYDEKTIVKYLKPIVDKMIKEATKST